MCVISEINGVLIKHSVQLEWGLHGVTYVWIWAGVIPSWIQTAYSVTDSTGYLVPDRKNESNGQTQL